MLFPRPASDVISVSVLNRLARDLLESGLPATWVSGEISNLTVAASGHAYFSLKDGGAQVRCVMFRPRLAQLPFKLGNGLQVELRGAATIYEARGDFQINVETMRAAGQGQLFEAFERLKARLAAEGLFAAERKKPLPAFPHKVGIVTSPAAAALRDVVTTFGRRMPGTELILYPTPVQGDGAARQIAAAILAADARAEVELLIVCRGGGSIEDLWAFNEEVVARAIAATRLPVISGVGHETDFTICDFVADLRAPTPTAAAELAVPDRTELAQRLSQLQQACRRAVRRRLDDKSQQLDLKAQRLRHPGERLERQRERLQLLHQRLDQKLSTRMQGARLALQRATSQVERLRPDLDRPAARLDALRQRLSAATIGQLHRRQLQLLRCQTTLTAINPEAVLERGYAIVQKMDGAVARSPQELAEGERIRLRLAQGSTEARIEHPNGHQPTLPF
jgi:exodeoxyribonuclease VII large subunit